MEEEEQILQCKLPRLLKPITGRGILSRVAEFALCSGISTSLQNYAEFDK